MGGSLVVIKVSLMCPFSLLLPAETTNHIVAVYLQLAFLLLLRFSFLCRSRANRHHRRSSSPPSSPSSSSSSSPLSSSRYGATTASATASTSPSTQSPNRQPRGATASPTASSESPALPSHGGGIGRWPLAPLTSRREKSWER